MVGMPQTRSPAHITLRPTLDVRFIISARPPNLSDSHRGRAPTAMVAHEIAQAVRLHAVAAVERSRWLHLWLSPTKSAQAYARTRCKRFRPRECREPSAP